MTMTLMWDIKLQSTKSYRHKKNYIIHTKHNVAVVFPGHFQYYDLCHFTIKQLGIRNIIPTKPTFHTKGHQDNNKTTVFLA